MLGKQDIHSTQMTSRTPLKMISSFSSSKSKPREDQFLFHSEFSPFPECIHLSFTTPYTPHKKHPEYLLSPSSIKGDLFTQLLATDNKAGLIMEQELENESQPLSSVGSQLMEDEQSSNEEENVNTWQDEYETKKRKRKSTVQIKMLKQELEGETNWAKDKIIQMAEITGLSQSQVYKWCWDQKKKNTKREEHKCLEGRRKLIKKQRSYAIRGRRNTDENQTEATKLKLRTQLESSQTERKVNKKLFFN